jgi:hypothetical protein
LDALLGVVSSFFAVFLFESLAIFWFPCSVSFFLSCCCFVALVFGVVRFAMLKLK